MYLKSIKGLIFSSLFLIFFAGNYSCRIFYSSVEKQNNSEINESLSLMDSIVFFEKHHNVIDKSNASYDQVLNFYVKKDDRPKFRKLPDNVFLCKNLETVDLTFIEDLDLESTFVKLSKLKKLKKLSLALSNLDSLPSNINVLKSLKTLELQGNCFKELPQNLSKLEQLESLNISLNFNLDLSQVFMVLGNCKRLRELSIEGLELNYLDKNIGRLKQLEFLDLDGNSLKELPCELMYLKKLNTLSLGYNDLDSLILPICFKALSKLGSRDVSFYNIEGEIMIGREKGYSKPKYIPPCCGKKQ